MTTVDLHAAEAGSGVPLVLLHAFPLSSAMWDAQRTGLAESCRVITPDLRGFGRSPLGTDGPSLDHLADDVAALLHRLALDRVVLGGLSMGGYVAMAFVRRHADRVAGLILADTKASADSEAARANRLRIADRLASAPGSPVLLDEVLPGLTGDTTKTGRKAVQARVRDLVAAAAGGPAAWAQRAMAPRPDSFATLRDVTVPSVVIVGDEDVLAPPADARAMADVLPGARLVVLSRAGHLSAMEDPDGFNSAVRDLVSVLA